MTATPQHLTAADLAPLFVPTEPGAPFRARVRLGRDATAWNPGAHYRGAPPVFQGPCRLTYYRHADGSVFAAAPDTSNASTPANDASGDELLSRIERGDKAAAMAWVERVGCFPSSCPESRAISRAAERLAFA